MLLALHDEWTLGQQKQTDDPINESHQVQYAYKYTAVYTKQPSMAQDV